MSFDETLELLQELSEPVEDDGYEEESELQFD